MKIILIALAINSLFAFEKTQYEMFEGKSKEELQTYFGLHKDFFQDTMLSMFMTNKITGMDLPESFDWRDEMPECVHAVRDQGRCGSCWAHSSSEVVSDRFCIHSKGKINQTFSPQQLVDCDYSEMGCGGGFLTNPFIFFSLIGAQTDGCYGQYTSGKTGHMSRFCFLKKWSCPVFKTKLMSIRWHNNPTSIKEDLIQNGPINTGFQVYSDFLNYKGGVYRHQSEDILGGHAVKIVGWGKDDQGEYWIVQNSWTEKWGENGFFRIAFGEGGIDGWAVSVMPSLQ